MKQWHETGRFAEISPVIVNGGFLAQPVNAFMVVLRSFANSAPSSPSCGCYETPNTAVIYSNLEAVTIFHS